MNDNIDKGFAYNAAKSFGEIMANSHKNMNHNLNIGNRGELFVLKHLYICKKDVLPSELSEAMNATTARVSALLATLEKKDQITRKIDPNNRRNILVSITPKGSERIEDELNTKMEAMIKIFSEMGEEDSNEFIKLSKKFGELASKHFQK